MEQSTKTPNWMKYHSMLQFYQQAQAAESGLEPDPVFLKDPNLGRYTEYKLKNLEIPQTIKDFLNQVGLPDRFLDHRSPHEKKDDKKSACPGFIFWISCLKVVTVKKKKYLIIGENRCLGRFSIVSGSGTPNETWEWNKSEEVAYIIVELKTGSVWKWIPDSYEDIVTFVNSSLEQYLLSMAYWRAFYPDFAKSVTDYLEKNPKKTELDYIFRNRKKLYAPFKNILEVLDPDALKKRMSYWKFMCDLSLY